MNELKCLCYWNKWRWAKKRTINWYQLQYERNSWI